MNIEINKITIGDNRRAVSLEKVSNLQESIIHLGLLNPITLSTNNVLIAGMHRLEACRRLGWTEIPANVTTLTGLLAELAEIDENLTRNNGTALDQTEWTNRRKEIYEALHPETKAKVAGAHASNKAQGKGNASADSAPASFTADTAAKTGRSQRAVQVDIQIASNLTDATKVAAAVRTLAAAMPTYITLKDVKKRWGHGQEDVFPVCQFEKLWVDMSQLSSIETRYIAVPRLRGQQLKDPSQLDGWLRDGSASYLESLCEWE